MSLTAALIAILAALWINAALDAKTEESKAKTATPGFKSVLVEILSEA